MASSGLTASHSRLSDLMAQTLTIDLETTRSGSIRHIGAIVNRRVFEKKERAGSQATLRELEEIARDADFVLGHNLLGHDFPVLRSSFPWLELLDKPVIDTLYLSPIAFPKPLSSPGKRLQTGSGNYQQSCRRR